MMTILWWVLFALCFSFGFLGCFINKIPGPIAVLIATILAITCLDMPISWGTVAIVAALAIGSMVASKMLVKMVMKVQEFSKRGGWGTTIGSILGLCVMSAVRMNSESVVLAIVMVIVGLVVLPFTFAFLLELTNKQDTNTTVKCATAATAAYLADTFLKLVVFIYAAYVLFFHG